MRCRPSPVLLGFWVAGVGLLAGCGQGPPPATGPEVPVVPVSQPVSREVTDYVDYTGRTAAVNAVDIRARVSGYLVSIPFQEGAEVRRGDLLFEIDPRPYQAQVAGARAQVALAEANYRLARAEYARSRAISARDPTAISREELEKYAAQEAQTQAQLGSARANLESTLLNLDFTRVTAPIDGQISRYYYTLGNLVIQDQTLLTTLVSVDPMYVYFDVDENTLLRVRNAINEGTIRPAASTNDIPVLMEVGNETGYPHRGYLNFINNTVNPSTGTLAVRGVFGNPLPLLVPARAAQAIGTQGLASLNVGAPTFLQPIVAMEISWVRPSTLPTGRRLLSPGMFVRVRLPLGQPHPALLVADRAIGFDQGLKFVYVIDADNKVQYRRVTTGPLEPDGLRVVQGIEPTDWVVVGALQQVRPRMQVEKEEMPMPTTGTPASGVAPAPVPAKPEPPPARK
jgi:RND family efflux transporter MFP subunit